MKRGPHSCTTRAVPQEIHLQANGVSFHALVDGPADGRLVLLLHGFPDLSVTWKHQLPALAAAGFRVVAPDLRGYGGTDRAGPYDLKTLANDVAGLVRACGRERAIVVGHDWGGAVAWGAAMFAPEVVERLVAVNGPHPAAFFREFLRSPSQAIRSGYMVAFQVPWLPERIFAMNGASVLMAMLHRWGRRLDVNESALYAGAFTTESIRAALGYYRAGARRALALEREAREHRVKAPTLIVWGDRDPVLGPGTLDPRRMRDLFEAGTTCDVRWVRGAGHFVHQDEPEAVNHALVEWLGSER